jgi:predicted DsbA family dithiol-disulfide isomerase
VQALVFVDVVDVWSYIGSVRFERAAALFTILTGEPVSISYRAAQFEHGGSVRDAVAAARISAIELNVDDIVPAVTDDAWRLLLWASDASQDQQRELLHQLWRGHFLEGTDIAEPFVLASRAVLVGLELEQAEALLASEEYSTQVRQQRKLASEFGADSAPFIVVDGSRTLAGVYSQGDYVHALQEIVQSR